MESQSLVYIGNQLSKSGKATVTVMETLSLHLRDEGFVVHNASHYKNKVRRLLHMMYTVVKHGRKAKAVLIDTYSTQNFLYAVAVGNLCRLLRIPYIPILHGGNLPQRLKKSPRLAYKLFHGAKTNVAPSDYLYNAFKKEGYGNLSLIPNAIEVVKYEFSLRKYSQPQLLWVRSFASLYNPMLALDVLEGLLPDFPNAELCMVGPEKDGWLERCKARAEKKNLPVRFTGKLTQEAWRNLSKDFDVFLNTTNFDNTPVSLIEAMALGLPIVSTKVGGIPYLIEHGTTGLMVPAENASAMMDAVKMLCNEPAMVEELSRQGRKKAETFDWSYTRDLWLKLLSK